MSHAERNEGFIFPVKWGKLSLYCDSRQYLLFPPLQFVFPVNLTTALIQFLSCPRFFLESGTQAALVIPCGACASPREFLGKDDRQ